MCFRGGIYDVSTNQNDIGGTYRHKTQAVQLETAALEPNWLRSAWYRYGEHAMTMQVVLFLERSSLSWLLARACFEQAPPPAFARHIQV